MVRNFI